MKWWQSVLKWLERRLSPRRRSKPAEDETELDDAWRKLFKAEHELGALGVQIDSSEDTTDSES